MSHWKSAPEEITSSMFGFVYRITNLQTGKYYIGRKQFWSVHKVKVPNRKNKKRVVVVSNWESYLSSSTQVKADIAKFGMDNFSFEIISIHKTKAELVFTEAKLIWQAMMSREEIYNSRSEPIYFNAFTANRVQFV